MSALSSLSSLSREEPIAMLEVKSTPFLFLAELDCWSDLDGVEEVLSPQSTQWGSSCCPEMETVSMEEN